LRRVMISILLLVLLLAGGCSSPAAPPPPNSTAVATEGVEAQAAREATVIVARARATAMVLKAQAEATSLAQPDSPTPEADPAGAVATAVLGTSTAPRQTPTKPNEEEYRIELLDVGYAGEGGFIIVRFHATRKAADDLWPGRLSVTDEATGAIYAEVPLMPVVGLLVGRPRSFDQIGYVMFTNSPPGLPPGSLVTIKLGKLTQEHVRVAAQ
jgi:hypothetical protein